MAGSLSALRSVVVAKTALLGSHGSFGHGFEHRAENGVGGGVHAGDRSFAHIPGLSIMMNQQYADFVAGRGCEQIPFDG